MGAIGGRHWWGGGGGEVGDRWRVEGCARGRGRWMRWELGAGFTEGQGGRCVRDRRSCVRRHQWLLLEIVVRDLRQVVTFMEERGNDIWK